MIIIQSSFVTRVNRMKLGLRNYFPKTRKRSPTQDIPQMHTKTFPKRYYIARLTSAGVREYLRLATVKAGPIWFPSIDQATHWGSHYGAKNAAGYLRFLDDIDYTIYAAAVA